MPNTTQGSVASLWRYPVKLMLGEELVTDAIVIRHIVTVGALRARLEKGRDEQSEIPSTAR